MPLGPRPTELPKRIPTKWWDWRKLPGRFHVRKPSAFWIWRKWRNTIAVRPEPTLVEKALKLAASQIGYKESPPDSNHTKYGVWYGMDHEPWCAIFVSWVLSHVGRAFKESYVPYIVAAARVRRSGLSVISYAQVAAALEAGHVVLACYDWEHDGTADHVEFVEKTLDNAYFQAIGGNTGPENLSNGGEVLRSKRPVNLVQAFVLVSS